MACPLKDIEILKVVDAATFKIREIPEADAFIELQRQIRNYCCQDDLRTAASPLIIPGELYLGRRSDRAWFRVKVECVLHTTNGPQASCSLIDTGQQKEMISKRWLREMPKEFLELPAQVKQCVLEGVTPVTLELILEDDLVTRKQTTTVWDIAATREVTRFVKDGSLAQALILLKDDQDVYHVRLFVTDPSNGMICLNEMLVERGFAIKGTGHKARSPVPDDPVRPDPRMPELIISTNPEQSDQCRTRMRRPRSGARTPAAHSEEDHHSDGEKQRHPPLGTGGGALDTVSPPGGTRGAGAGRGLAWTPPRGGASDTVAPSSGTRGAGASRGLTLTPPGGGPSDTVAPSGGTRGAGAGRGLALTPPRGGALDTVAPPLAMGRGNFRRAILDALTVTSPARAEPVVGGNTGSFTGGIVGSGSGSGSGSGGGGGGGSPRQPGAETADTSAPRAARNQMGGDGDSPARSTADHGDATSGAGSSALPDPHPHPPSPVRAGIRHRGLYVTSSDEASGSSTRQARLPKHVALQGAARRPPSDAEGPRGPQTTATTPLHVHGEDLNHRGLNTHSQVDLQDVGASQGGGATQDTPASRARLGVWFSDTETTPEPRRPSPGLVPKQSILKQTDRSSGSEDGSRLSGGAAPNRPGVEAAAAARPSVVFQSDFLSGFAGASPGFSSTSKLMGEAPKPTDYGVIVLGSVKPPCKYRVDDLPFHDCVKESLAILDVTKATPLQMYVWPALLRGRDVIGVAPSSASRNPGGKSLAHLAPVLTQLRQPDTYSKLPIGCGPYAVVLCSSAQDAHNLYDQCRTLLHRDRSLRVLVTFVGGADESVEINLINGCEVLISTPHCLLRMLDKGVTSFNRLCHMVLEDADCLTEDFAEQVQDVMGRFQGALLQRGVATAPRQTAAFAQQWTAPLRQFASAFMQQPITVIASKMEAAFCGSLRHVPLMTSEDQKLDTLLSMLEPPSGLQRHKLAVFVDTAKEAAMLQQAFQSFSRYSLLAHEDMPLADLDLVSRDWNLPHAADSLPILVATDAVLDDLKVSDAGCVVHYSLPREPKLFERRLWAMRDCFVYQQEAGGDVSEEKCPLSFLILTDSSGQFAARTIRLLQRCDVEIPQRLRQLAERHLQAKERSHRSQLCRFLKAFGVCRDKKRCPGRHLVYTNLDSPAGDPRHVPLPSEGQVKILVTYVHHASYFSARLLEVTDNFGKVTTMAQDFSRLQIDMNFHFLSPSRRVYCEKPEKDHLYAWENVQHIFNRVQILSLSEVGRRGVPDGAKVWFVDSGEVRVLPTAELLILPDRLEQVPLQAVDVYVCRVKPQDQGTEWSPLAGSLVSERILHKELVGNIALSLGGTMWLDPLVHRTRLDQLKVVMNDFSVRNLLLDNGMATANSNHMQLLYKLCDDRLELPSSIAPERHPARAFTFHGLLTVSRPVTYLEPGQSVDVIVSAVDSPDLLYIQRSADSHSLDQLKEDIDQYVCHTKAPPMDQVTLGSLVLAKFPIDDIWYRGKVQEVTGDQRYDVLFLDYGDMEVVELSSLRPLPSRFQTQPFFALECCMVGLKPKGDGDWGEEAGDVLNQITKTADGAEKVLVAKVVSRSNARQSGVHRYGIELVDTTNEYDVDLRNALVATGAAAFESRVLEDQFAVEDDGMGLASRISAFCRQLLCEQGAEDQQQRATEIQHLVVGNLRVRDDLVQSGVLRCTVILLECVSDWTTVQLLLVTLVKLYEGSEQNSEVLQRVKGVGVMCALLDKACDDHSPVVETIIWGVKELTESKSCLEALHNLGGVRLVSKAMLASGQISVMCVGSHVMVRLAQSVPGGESARPLNPLWVRALVHTLHTATAQPTATNCLRTLELLAKHRWRDCIRKYGGVKVICEQLESWTSLEIVAQAIKTLKVIANNNRFNKDVMIDLNLKDILQRLSKDGRHSEDTRRTCEDFYQRLHDVTRREMGARGSPARPTGSVANGNKASPKRQEIQNEPLPPKFCSNEIALKKARPEVLWAQTRWDVLLTVKVKDVSGPQAARITEDSVTFSAVSESTEFSFELRLYEVIQTDKCKVKVTPGSVMIGLRKAARGTWPRLLRDKRKLPFVYNDYEKFADSSSESSNDDEPTSCPLDLSKRNVYRHVSFIPREPLGGATIPRGMPPEMDESSDEDDDSVDSSDELLGLRDSNAKYDYFRL